MMTWALAFWARTPRSARRFGSKIVGESGVRVFSFVFISVLARRIGAAQFGVYSTILAYATLFLIIVEFANNAIITREIARRPDDRALIICSAHALKIGFAVLTMIGIHLFRRTLTSGGVSSLLIDSLGFVVLSYALIDYTGALLAGKEEMGQEAKLRIICRTLLALSGIGCVLLTGSLLTTAVTMAIVGVFSVLYGQTIILKRFEFAHFRIDRATIERILKSSLPLLATYAFSLVYDNQDILLLKHFLISNQQIGLYWSASKVLDVLKVVPVLLVGAFFPTLSKLVDRRSEFSLQLKSLLRWCLILVPIIVVGAYATAPYLQRFLFGATYASAAPLLRLLLFAYGSTFFNYVSSYVLIAANRERWLLPGAAAVCVLNFLLCWKWIPIWGSTAVCYSLIISEAVYLLYQGSLILIAFRSSSRTPLNF